jgi:hypothetical protein
VGLRYRFGAGWKFVRIEPKDAAARKIEGGPRAFGIWVHGDGQGGAPCIRLRDATGQVHQVRGEPVSWKGWRYVTFPLRPAADSGQTLIPLCGSGAEQRVSWSHWGGANDGEVHFDALEHPPRVGFALPARRKPAGDGGRDFPLRADAGVLKEAGKSRCVVKIARHFSAGYRGQQETESRRGRQNRAGCFFRPSRDFSHSTADTQH